MDRAGRGGEQGAADEVTKCPMSRYRHYLRHPVVGGWYDQSIAQPIVGRVDSGLFILPRSLRGYGSGARSQLVCDCHDRASVDQLLT